MSEILSIAPKKVQVVIVTTTSILKAQGAAKSYDSKWLFNRVYNFPALSQVPEPKAKTRKIRNMRDFISWGFTDMHILTSSASVTMVTEDEC